VPKVPCEKAGAAAFGLRGIREKLVTFNCTFRPLRKVWRPSRPRRVLDGRHELALAARTYSSGAFRLSERIFIRAASINDRHWNSHQA
jgi:hypothetical protein